MVEVLVTLLVLAVGLLGLLGMQLAGRRAIFEASQRTVATGLARDMLERIRANPGQLERYRVRGLGGASLAATLSAPPVDCAAASCSPEELAAWDVHDWHRRLLGAAGEGPAWSGGLVSPRACITGAAGSVEVTISWRGVGEWEAPGEPEPEPEPEPDGADCGLGEGLYGTEDRQRRLLVIRSYVRRD